MLASITLSVMRCYLRFALVLLAGTSFAIIVVYSFIQLGSEDRADRLAASAIWDATINSSGSMTFTLNCGAPSVGATLGEFMGILFPLLFFSFS